MNALRRELDDAGFFATSSRGIAGQSVQSWAARSSGFIGVLVALLRTVAILDALVCLYAIAQLLALTVRSGAAASRPCARWAAGTGSSRASFRAAAPVVVLAILVGVAAQRWLVGPAVARLAASYVSLTLEPSAAGVGVDGTRAPWSDGRDGALGNAARDARAGRGLDAGALADVQACVAGSARVPAEALHAAALEVEVRELARVSVHGRRDRGRPSRSAARTRRPPCGRARTRAPAAGSPRATRCRSARSGRTAGCRSGGCRRSRPR